MCMNHIGCDRDATAAYHVALDKKCYHTDSDLSRVELFASFALFTMPISASFTTLEDPIDHFWKVQIRGREDGRGKVNVQQSSIGLESECFPNGTRRQPGCETGGVGCTSHAPRCSL